LRRSRWAAGALDGVNVASLALMAVVTWQFGRAALADLPTVGLAVATVIGVLVWRVNPLWFMAIGAAIGSLWLT
jgi:chromate transporter